MSRILLLSVVRSFNGTVVLELDTAILSFVPIYRSWVEPPYSLTPSVLDFTVLSETADTTRDLAILSEYEAVAFMDS